MVPFAGWSMPVQYSSIISEHESVRKTAGLFDVSHMGEIIVKGKDALIFLESLTCNDISKMALNQVQYNAVLNANGGLVDDITIYKEQNNSFFICSNASNYEKVYKHLLEYTKDYKVEIKNESVDWHQIAIQGPKAETIFCEITGMDTSKIAYFHFQDLEYKQSIIRISRTGYTGEDGFEIYSDNKIGIEIWETLIQEGASRGLVPVGLGARDTLRLEAGYPLYGHELGDSLTPVESGLAWIVKEKDTKYLGYKKILDQKTNGCSQQVVGFMLNDRGVPRDNMPVLDMDGNTIGKVLSGSHSPTLKKGIGTALLPIIYTKPGTKIQIKIRDQPVSAIIHKGGFVKGSAGKK